MDLPTNSTAATLRSGKEISQEIRRLTLERREIGKRDKEIGSELDKLKDEFMAWAKDQGLSKLAGDGVNLEVVDEDSLDVGDWLAFQRWCSEMGVIGFQKRATVSVVRDLVKDGAPLPSEVASLGTFPKVKVTGVK